MMNRIVRFTVLSVLLFVSTSLAADWPNFRGPNHNGISSETAFKKTNDKPLKMLWDREVGSAFSSFAVVGDRVYTCGTQNKQQVLFALNAGTGAIVWQTPIEGEFKQEFGDGTRATPTVDGDYVYILGALGHLMCVKAASGELVWDKHFSHMPRWAYAGSVLIEGDLAIASAGASDGALVAFDKLTGKERWRTGDEPVGYATPYPFTFHGKRYIVGFMAKSVIIVEATSGKLAAEIPWETDWDVNAASPIVEGDKLFITSGYSTGSALFEMSLAGDRIETKELWRSKVVLNKFLSGVLYEGYLYTSDQKSMKCIDFATGEKKWEIRKIKHSPLMMADGYIIMLRENGELQIGKASPDGFTPKTKAEILSGKCWSVPVLVDGKLYARNLERVACFDLR